MKKLLKYTLVSILALTLLGMTPVNMPGITPTTASANIVEFECGYDEFGNPNTPPEPAASYSDQEGWDDAVDFWELIYAAFENDVDNADVWLSLHDPCDTDWDMWYDFWEWSTFYLGETLQTLTNLEAAKTCWESNQ